MMTEERKEENGFGTHEDNELSHVQKVMKDNDLPFFYIHRKQDEEEEDDDSDSTK